MNVLTARRFFELTNQGKFLEAGDWLEQNGESIYDPELKFKLVEALNDPADLVAAGLKATADMKGAGDYGDMGAQHVRDIDGDWLEELGEGLVKDAEGLTK